MVGEEQTPPLRSDSIVVEEFLNFIVFVLLYFDLVAVDERSLTWTMKSDNIVNYLS